MLAPSSDLLRAGLELKLNQVKRAARSYLRDRTDHATSTVTSYAIAAGLFATSGIFLIAALLVGLAALFRWVELTYGRFQAFGVIGGLLVLIAIICAALAAMRLKRPPPHYPSLASRLRVAITANPLKRDRTATAMHDTAAGLLTPAMASHRAKSQPLRDNREVQAGLIFAAFLLGWAAIRRKSQRRQIKSLMPRDKADLR